MPHRALVDVLVVDDHPGHAGVTADLLRGEDLTVLTASTIEDAADLCRVRRFNVVILDRSVAGADADRFMTTRGLPSVVVVSGADRAALEAFRARYPQAVHAVIRKPVPPPELIRVVGEAIAETRFLRGEHRR